MEFNILFEDEYYIAIDKPDGYFVHRTALDKKCPEIVMPILRDQIGSHVFPMHRLDRPTSGVLLFAKSSDAAASLRPAFDNHDIQKRYLAVTRGHPPLEKVIDIPLLNKDKGKIQEATTRLKTLAISELPLKIDKYPTSRFALVELLPLSGRMHQLRKHCAKINYPIVGDYQHGDYRQNQYFKNEWQCDHLLLHAEKLSFRHPYHFANINIEVKIPDYFEQILSVLGLSINRPALDSPS